MKETPLSTCERTALTDMVECGLRHDRRGFLEARDTTISFGREYGSCSVILGETRVLAQVTCEVVEPRASRPSEGKLSIAVHLSPMAAPHLEPGGGGGGAEVDALQQVLERNIKESRCLDLESLCIRAEESVWQLRVDITVLNHDGNLCDASNMAAVAALRHFHRPDVLVEEDGRVTVLSHATSPPVPTFMRKVPVCVSYALVCPQEDKCLVLMDPTHVEERVMTGKLVAGLNPHGDITSLVFPGRVALKKEQIMKCLEHAFRRAKIIAEMVQQAVEDDLQTRATEDRPSGFRDKLVSDEEYKRQRFTHLMATKVLTIPTESTEAAVPMEEEPSVPKEQDPANDSTNNELVDDPDDLEESRTSAVIASVTKTSKNKKKVKKTKDVKMDSDSEEEQQHTLLTSQDLQ
ncbi:hypothetical protein Pmani_030000 [Petrolisthes manimaculis]|uniref:Exosome complex component RRP45 n=1 Tax=Petrolisthes manimaculis TaxID=1843537 RepID=A0AAE1NWG9_9EUCA|nr:hypothetical protein Pmani_030000 [Petrolisthes manimaculis]